MPEVSLYPFLLSKRKKERERERERENVMDSPITIANFHVYVCPGIFSSNN